MNNAVDNKPYPSFIIGGAAKSGTTSLSRYLSQLPEIYIPQQEPNYFTYAGNKPGYKVENHSFIYDAESYQNLLTPVDLPQNDTLIGEKSVSYLYKGYYSRVIQNIKTYHTTWQKLKWIFILRNPVERAYSQYIHNLNFHEDLLFRDAVQKWPDRKARGWIPAYDYLGAGYYYDALRAYTFEFDEVQVYLFEDLIHRPKWLMQNMLKFLNVNTSQKEDSFKKYNPSGVPKNQALMYFFQLMNKAPLLKTMTENLVPSSLKRAIKKQTHKKPPLSPTDKNKFIDYYKNDILKLELLIDRDLSNWYKEGAAIGER